MHKTERILSISFELAKVPKLIIWSFSHLETLTGAWQENEVGRLFQLWALQLSTPHLLALWSIHHFFIGIDQVYQMINGLNWSSLGTTHHNVLPLDLRLLLRKLLTLQLQAAKRCIQDHHLWSLYINHQPHIDPSFTIFDPQGSSAWGCTMIHDPLAMTSSVLSVHNIRICIPRIPTVRICPRLFPTHYWLSLLQSVLRSAHYLKLKGKSCDLN